MNVLSLVTPYLRRLKYFAPVFFIAVVTYFICLRYPSKLKPWYLYVGVVSGISILIILIILLIKKIKNRRMSAGLEAGLSEGEEGKVDLGGEIKALRENWKSSLDQLKASGLGQNRAVLFQLPWYIIIGEPASGKSTLLRKSGLDFPVGDASVSGLHGTRNCDWWFANEAIFLDTAGRYVIETQEAEWVAFLDLLKKYRKKKPINGVLIALPANSLLTKSHDELLLDGKRIRARIDELIEHLGVNFPIYVLVTKCDLVAGFVEYFGSLDQRYGEQMVGWTNPSEVATSFDRDAFSERFDEVSGRLFRMRPWLESTVKKRDLLKAFLYPEEFLNLGEPLREVLDIVFRPNVYQETPVCRGIYFSSGTQVGSPLAKTLEEMAKDLNIPADFDMGLEMEEEKEVRAYFIKDLVSQQILKDKEMTWRTWQAEARVRKRRRGRGILWLGILAFAGILAVSSFFTNQGRLGEFEVSIDEDALPLEAGIGCLDTRDSAKSPGLLDVGLNFNDELIPAMTESFKKVFGKGCVTPTLEEFMAIAKAGPVEKQAGPRKVKDIYSYFIAYGHYWYFRDALEGRIAEEQQDYEKKHLDYLFPILVRKRAAEISRSDTSSLRRSLYEYFAAGDLPDFPLIPEIKAEFDRHLLAWLGEVEKWVARQEGSQEGFQDYYRRALNGLKDACLRNKVIPHDNREKVFEIAAILQDAASPAEVGSGPRGPRLVDLCFGVGSVVKLKGYMQTAKDLAKDGKVPPKVDDLTARIDKHGRPESTGQAKQQQQARDAILVYLEGIITSKVPPTVYNARPARDDLRSQRTRITGGIREATNSAWRTIQPQVIITEGNPTAVLNPDGTPKKGWWDTLLDLTRAKYADALQEEYLVRGLRPYLKGQAWKKHSPDEEKDDVYTVGRIRELILSEILNQRQFYANDELATNIRGNAEKTLRGSLDTFITEMEEHWLESFEAAIPRSSAHTLTQLYEHLDMWSDPRSTLNKVCRRIQGAVYGIRKIGDEEAKMPLLKGSQDARDRMFETFLLCFSDKTDDPDVMEGYTVELAGKGFDPLKSAIEPLSGGTGADMARARRFLGELMQGGGLRNPFAKAMKTVEDLRKAGPTGSPPKKLARWMETGIRNGWDDLVNLTARDINDAWGQRVAVWQPPLSGGDNAAFKRIFGPNGEFLAFRKEYMEPFFVVPGYTIRLKQPGASLAAEVGFQNLEGVGDSRPTGPMKSDGTWISEQIRVQLGLGGTLLAEELRVEYSHTNGQPIVTPPYRNDVPVEITLDWSPNVCRGLRFIVDLGGGEMKTMEWTGPWAVAQACFKAKKQGSKYIWQQEEPGRGRWEVHLTVTGQTRLIGWFRESGGNVSGATRRYRGGTLPGTAVRVVK